MKKYSLPLLGLFILLGVLLTYNIYSNNKNPYFNNDHDLCLKCHEMKNKGETLSMTAHKNFSCNSCHYDINNSMFYLKHITNRYVKPVEINNLPSNKICLQCHSVSRNITPPPNLIIPHKLHIEIGVDCLDCHEFAAHGDSDKPNLGRIERNTCLKCHNGNKATNKCLSCHLIKPEGKVKL